MFSQISCPLFVYCGRLLSWLDWVARGRKQCRYLFPHHVCWRTAEQHIIFHIHFKTNYCRQGVTFFACLCFWMVNCPLSSHYYIASCKIWDGGGRDIFHRYLFPHQVCWQQSWRARYCHTISPLHWARIIHGVGLLSAVKTIFIDITLPFCNSAFYWPSNQL